MKFGYVGKTLAGIALAVSSIACSPDRLCYDRFGNLSISRQNNYEFGEIIVNGETRTRLTGKFRTVERLAKDGKSWETIGVTRRGLELTPGRQSNPYGFAVTDYHAGMKVVSKDSLDAVADKSARSAGNALNSLRKSLDSNSQ